MSEKIKSFRDLRIWQKGMFLVEQAYKITADFPKVETYGLAVQLQRSAVSIPSNIAEGFRRKHLKEYKHFLTIALGSCAELETQIEIAFRIGYLSQEKKNEIIEEIDYLCKMIQTLIKRF